MGHREEGCREEVHLNLGEVREGGRHLMVEEALNSEEDLEEDPKAAHHGKLEEVHREGL